MVWTEGRAWKIFVLRYSGTTSFALVEQNPAADESKPKVHSRKTPENRVRQYRTITPNGDGTFTIPARYGAVTLITLGNICSEPNFHTERYIYPIGYHVRRPFLSTHNQSETEYECRIKDDDGPLFEVKSFDGVIYTGRSASGAWIPIVHAAHKLRDKPLTSSVCGPDLFGFTSPEIALMIQNLNGADQCSKYKKQSFVLKE